MDEMAHAKLGVALVIDILERGMEFTLFPMGMSMTPFILDKEKVVIRQTNLDQIRVGSVVAFLDETKSWIVLHRVLEVDRDKRQALTMGDCQIYPETVEADRILGLVIRIEKDDFLLDMESLRVRLCNYLIANYSKFFFLFYSWRQKHRLRWLSPGGILLRARLTPSCLVLASLRCLSVLEYFWRQRSFM